jgi:response regulator RpfG family c-di-GMP phosphodiesterase
MEKELINILYVDDEVHNLNAFRASFRRVFNVFTAESAKDAMGILEKQTMHVIISDQRMPFTTGVEFLQSIIPIYPEPIRILLTGYADMSAVVDAINKGQVYLYLTKPWQEDELRQNIERAYEIFSLREQNKTLTDQLLVVNEQLEFMFRQKLIS